MSEDSEDIKFQNLLAQKRHEELKSAIKSIAPKDNKDIVAAIEKQAEYIERFSNAIKQLPKPEKPNVSVEVNQDKVIESVNSLVEKIVVSNNNLLNELKKYNQRPVLESFKIIKDNYGNTRSVDLIYKK